jgi:hypothetical protein
LLAEAGNKLEVKKIRGLEEQSKKQGYGLGVEE